MILRKFLWFVSVVLCFGLVSVSAQSPVPKIISGGVVNGKAISLTKPVYPAAAQAVKASGTVNVEIIIDEQGNIESATAVSGHPLLRAAAVDAARQSKFAPTTLSGVLVKVKGIVVYNFVAGEKTSSDLSESGEEKTQELTFTVDPSSDGGFFNGRATNLPKPEYPAAARAVNASGSVIVEVVIDVEGNVTSAQAVSGHPLLRQSAEEAARNAKFRPTLREGIPGIVKGKVVYNFAPAVKTESADTSDDKNSANQPKTISGGVLNSMATSFPKPTYPAAARAVRASGSVNVEVVVDEQGNVTSASAVSGHPLLRAASVAAAKQVKFAPMTLSGNPVKVVGIIIYNFVP